MDQLQQEPQNKKTGILAVHYPVAVAIVVCLLINAVLVISAVSLCRGNLIYALDDSYIHLALAKNVAFHGVWGVTRYDWSSASSSPAYTILLASLFRVFGLRDIIPFIINTVASVCILLVLYRIMCRRAKELSQPVKLVFLLVVSLILPLPLFAIIGMEHGLHTLLCIILLERFADMNDSDRPQKRQLLIFLLLAGFTMLVRFETGFVLVPMFIYLMFRKRWQHALLIALAGAIPVLGFAAISVHYGAMPLPNSVLIKSGINELTRCESTTAAALYMLKSIWITVIIARGILLPAAILFVVSIISIIKRKLSALIFVPLVTVIEHLCFAAFGQGRYEAYLIGMIAVAFIYLAADVQKWAQASTFRYRWLAVCLLPIVMFCPMRKRVYLYAIKCPRWSANIYGQQYQMGLFLRKYYQGKTVIANDIGAISYLADIKLVDAIGLANNQIAKYRHDRNYRPEYFEQICRDSNVSIAVVYDSWCKGLVSKSWTKKSIWELSDNVVCGGSIVSFYLTKPSLTAQFEKNMVAFSRKMPSSERVIIFY